MSRPALAGLVLAALLACAQQSAHATCQGADVLARMAVDAPADLDQIQRAARLMPFSEGRLFRITRAGVPASYLFGTLHIADRRIAEIPPAARQALAGSYLVALETLDFDKHIPKARLQSELTAPPPERAGALLDAEAFRHLRSLLARRGYPPALAATLKAPALALMLDLPPCARPVAGDPPFIDAQVLAAAKAASVPVMGLESSVEQVAIADGLPPAVQTALLSAMLAQSSGADGAAATNVTLYLDGKIGTMLAWAQAAAPIPGRPEGAIPSVVADRLVAARTRRMLDRLGPHLAQGGLFIAVGALHIPGRSGLGALLQDAGYGVERVDPAR